MKVIFDKIASHEVQATNSPPKGPMVRTMEVQMELLAMQHYLQIIKRRGDVSVRTSEDGV